VVQKPGTARPFVRPFLTNCILKALQNGYVDSLIHGLALGKKLEMHQTLRVKESDQHCLDIWLDLPRFLRPRWRQRLPLWPNTVSLNAFYSISYVFVAVLPSFWQNLMQTCCSFNTSILQYDRGTITIALYITLLTTESCCHPLLWCVASDVAKYPTWLSLRYY
jgi:hypothetical protein